jgi:hypothetical protein
LAKGGGEGLSIFKLFITPIRIVAIAAKAQPISRSGNVVEISHGWQDVAKENLLFMLLEIGELAKNLGGLAAVSQPDILTKGD